MSFIKNLLLRKYFYITFLYILSFTLCDPDPCYIDVKHFGQKDSPILINKLNIIKPIWKNNGAIYFKVTKKDLSLACPGEGNRFEMDTNNLLKANCWQEWPEKEWFNIRNNYYTTDSVLCLNDLIASERPTNETCFNNGQIYEVGFNLGSNMLVLYKVCYNDKYGYTQYAEHTIQGFENFPLKTKSLFKGFTLFNLQIAKKIIHMPYFFIKSVQRERLGPQLGPENTNIYITGSNVITGIALVPHADFLVMSHHMATHSLVNIQNIWSPRLSIWRSVEANIRSLANNKKTYKITTGVYEMVKNDGKILFMGPRQTIPIFSHLWKYIFDEDNKACIMIMMENINIDQVHSGCRMSCQQSGWLTSLNKKDQQYVFCCTPSEIKAIPNLPISIDCINILKK